MDFTIDSEQKALREAAAELASRHAPQHGHGDVPVGPAEHDPQVWSALADMGALGLPFPEASGGFGATAVEVSLVATELGRAEIQTAYADALVAAALLVDAGQTELTAAVSGPHGIDLGGTTELPVLGALLRDAAVVVVANTGPAHLAAAVGTPSVAVAAVCGRASDAAGLPPFDSAVTAASEPGAPSRRGVC